MGRWGGTLLALVILAGFGLWLWWSAPLPGGRDGGRTADGERDPVAVAVETAPVGQDTVRELRSFTGTLQPAAQFQVAPKVGGRLIRLDVDIGDRVERGQIIARMDDDEHVQDVAQAEAELQVAQAQVEEARSNLTAARRELERIQQLRRQNLASESQLDAAQAEAQALESRVRVALAQVAQRQAALEAARVRLSYTVIRADWEGEYGVRVVGERLVDEGTTLSANTPVVSLLGIGELLAVVYAAERDYPRLHLGQDALISVDAYAGERFAGQVLRIAPQFREASRQARIEVRVPNPEERLKPGMFVRVQVQLAQADDAQVVPVEAVVSRNRQSGVFLVEEGDEGPVARFVPVRTGISEGSRVQILEPTLQGRVVTLGQHLLDDGTPLRPADPGAAWDDVADAS